MPTTCQRPAPRIVDHPCYYAADGRAPGDARRHVRARLGTWGLGELADDAETVVSELVTNAVLHGSRGQSAGWTASCTRSHGSRGSGEAGVADGQVALRLELTGSGLVARVWDPSPAPPEPRGADADPLAEHGNGLLLVETLSSRWGWYPSADGGKVVWSAIEIKQETAEATAISRRQPSSTTERQAS